MKLWPLLSLFLLASQSALPGQGVAVLEQKGDDALASGLWEIAESRFRECLADPSLTADEKAKVGVRLAESLIRAGKSPEALECLNLSFVAKNPESLFWKAQAIARTGHFAEAVEIFSQLLADPKAPYRTEAGFSKANLLLALEKSDGALETLENLANEADPQISNHARLLEVEILLDLQQAAEARKRMPLGDQVSVKDRPLAAFLEANLLLEEGHFPEAANAFLALVSQKQGQTLARHHSAVIGYADALKAQGDQEGAAKYLLTFIQANPDSPVLDATFKRLEQWLPDSPPLTDPILEQLAKWTEIRPSELPALGPVTNSPDTGSAAAWPIESIPNDLLAYSLFTQAIGLHRINTPKSKWDARVLMDRLRLEYPDHSLANLALYQMARWLLDEGSADHALALLDTLRDTTKSPALRGEAAFLEARSAYLNGDPKKAFQLFDEAASALTDGPAKAARLNAGIARLRSGELNGVTQILQNGVPQDKELEADLELERALSTTPPDVSRKAIEEFLAKYPDHPRAAEARLAMAEAALTSQPPDLSFASEQLDSLTASAEASAALPPAKLALVRLRIADLSNDPAATIALARSMIATYPGTPEAADATLTLGRNLFETKDYNLARLALENLAFSDSDPERAQAAWLLAARSAALVPTPSSKEQALKLFDKAVALPGPLLSIAKLEKADHLIKNLSRYAEAAAFLRKWFDSLPKADPLRLPVGLLLGDALYALGSTSPNSYAQTLEIYDQLLPLAVKYPALTYRLQYLRGRALEEMPDPKDPTKKREGQALIAYYSVLETTTPPVEWDYFEQCGFRALALLKKAGRWQAAIACAKKIASFNGPKAKDAAEQASHLQLEHMIWED
ncbi:MAG: tetratricopeptide repeat protein [Luteolibacter sp.]